MQDKEVLEAAVRAFEDWEFRVLEKESGVGDDDDESNAEETDHGSDMEVEKEIKSQQLLVNASQVKNIYLTLGCRVCNCVLSPHVILLRDILVEDGLMDNYQ